MNPNKITKLMEGTERREVDGWIMVKIGGEPYNRGFQHGYLLAKEIQDAIRVNKFLALWDTGEDWDFFVKNAVRLFADKLNEEFTQELKGIAEGAKYQGIDTSFEEILTWNSYQDLLGSWWPSYLENPSSLIMSGHRCSAFIAVGEATKDGNIVMAHNTWDRYAAGDHYNIILDITPSKGNRMIFQSPPGYISSTMDWWVTSAGLIICETTIGGFSGFNTDGTPEFYRSRVACQYANSIPEWKERMCDQNNGGYPGSWLVGNTHQNEIARIEVGLKYIGYETKNNGFYSGYNVATDLKIRNQECNNAGAYSNILDNGARRTRFMELLSRKVDTESAKQIIADHYDVYLKEEGHPCSRTICGHLELDDARYGSHAGQGPYYPWGANDGKVVDSTMAKAMRFEGRWGHACGMPFDADHFLEQNIQYNWLKGYMKNRSSHEWQSFSLNQS